MACVDHLQRARVGRVVVAEEMAVVDGEAIAPEVQLAVGARRRGGDVGAGVWNSTRGSIVAAERSTCAAEVRAGWLLIVTPRPGSVSASVSLSGAVTCSTNLLSRPLEDVVDLVPRIRLVGVLDREARLLPTGKEVLVLIVVVIIIVVIIIVSVSVSVSATA